MQLKQPRPRMKGLTMLLLGLLLGPSGPGERTGKSSWAWLISMQIRQWRRGWGLSSWPSCLLERRRSWPISLSSTVAHQNKGSMEAPEGTEVVFIPSASGEAVQVASAGALMVGWRRLLAAASPGLRGASGGGGTLVGGEGGLRSWTGAKPRGDYWGYEAPPVLPTWPSPGGWAAPSALAMPCYPAEGQSHPR